MNVKTTRSETKAIDKAAGGATVLNIASKAGVSAMTARA
jgi:hypothetical protein